jgi:hypothetical protein
MPRFQLVFRTERGDVSEIRDNAVIGVPSVNGVDLTDGMIFAHEGSEWLASKEIASDGMVRFVCTPVQVTSVGY